jgi:hypothetical protein
MVSLYYFIFNFFFFFFFFFFFYFLRLSCVCSQFPKEESKVGVVPTCKTKRGNKVRV